ncbi:RagB/SusD family nutrient uptake outer membrane protein [Maribellus maritimus]|uniref:RagB/SusD family nutrient uptake outer membrane protein n=1 Tax=Maribellus maritimus TaxID=2870838 RepID=UPI001EEC9C1A|nr:RagB/SusD family nutrient uptake outer membrane protein [Maribellus maritimus]MCG6190485.1 RagB/SusD family nutrient uptake outer membrane protein [Maribellus maritimus]
MKKNILYIGLIALLMVTSCEEPIELYPLDVPSAETFYTNEVEIQGGVNACYSYIDAYQVSYLNPGFSWDALSDVVYSRGNSFTIGYLGSTLDYTHGYFQGLWRRMYQGVGRCNLILEKIEENKDLIAAEKVKQFQGEVYFLRAFYYLRLTNMFGDVVYLDAPVNSVEEASNVTRTARTEVLQKIYADFDMAAQLLAGSEVTALGRATSGAAMAYKARAALQNNDWATAATAAKSVIDSKQYSLMPSYETLFTEDVIESTENTEQIFSQGHLVEAGTQTQYVRYTASRALGGWSTIVPTQNMIDSYLCVDGMDISESPLYDKSNPYDNRDPRMRYSLVLPGDLWGDYIYETRLDKPETLNAAGETVTNRDSYNTTEFTSFTGYLIRKYFEFKYVTNSAQCENPFMLCRYAEVLLTYAEAKIELGEIDADCLAAINEVRGRSDVMMPEVTAGSQDEMRKIVRAERKIELFNENLRWDDLKRWKRAEVVLNRPILGRPVLGDYEGYPDVEFDEYGDPVYDVASYVPHPSTDYRVVLNTNFQQRDYLWPIPETELSLNPALGQNDGW